ncbi:LOW QUALITY PROTEIN: uncharacterized protein LOC119100304, partial [Pollicipes pollicipes]|uniref:LOW QUALITY PROTEIN: uncharacterized protein LOC119100304 n=1 Tax=Pollicipes pollicipes TaxID=41117 RepID=UPI001884BB2D
RLAVTLLVTLGVTPVTRANPDARRLYDDLLSNYNRLIRPVSNASDRVTVKLGLRLSQLMDLNLKDQILTTNVWVEHEWKDHKFVWEPREYGGVTELYVPAEHIWLPDIVLYNNADGEYVITTLTKAIIYYDGRVVWHPPAIFKSYCEIDVRYFPFDQQQCFMKFGSWTYDGFQIDLRHIHQSADSNFVELGIDLKEYYPSVEWDILRAPATRHEKFYPCCVEPYPDIYFNVTLRRKTLFYTVNLIIPCVGLSYLSVLVFYLPADSGEKVALCITILLSQTMFFLLISEIIPSTSLAVPLLGKYLLFTMILVTISVISTIVILNIHYRKPSTHKMAPWVRSFFIHELPRFILMRMPERDAPASAPFEPSASAPLGAFQPVHAEMDESARLQALNFFGDERRYPFEIERAIQNVKFVHHCWKVQDQFDEEDQDWAFIAMVIDRVLLLLFGVVSLLGTFVILCESPFLYDTTQAIDVQLSEVAHQMAVFAGGPSAPGDTRVVIKADRDGWSTAGVIKAPRRGRLGATTRSLPDLRAPPLKPQAAGGTHEVSAPRDRHRASSDKGSRQALTTAKEACEQLRTHQQDCKGGRDRPAAWPVRKREPAAPGAVLDAGMRSIGGRASDASRARLRLASSDACLTARTLTMSGQHATGRVAPRLRLRGTLWPPRSGFGPYRPEPAGSGAGGTSRGPRAAHQPGRRRTTPIGCGSPVSVCGGGHCPDCADIYFNVTLRRKTLFYTVNLIIPCVGLSYLSVLVFYLPADSGEKVALCITILLSQTMFFLLISEIIPSTSLAVPLLGKYLLFTMILVTISVISTIVILNIHYRKPSTHKMAPWVRSFFIHELPRFILMRMPERDAPASAPFEPSASAPLGAFQPVHAEMDESARLQALNFFGDERRYPFEIERAIQNVKFVHHCWKVQDQFDEEDQDWAFIAMVIDRVLLLLFGVVSLLGTFVILCESPFLYDTTQAIDVQLSEVAHQMAVFAGDV